MRVEYLIQIDCIRPPNGWIDEFLNYTATAKLIDYEYANEVYNELSKLRFNTISNQIDTNIFNSLSLHHYDILVYDTVKMYKVTYEEMKNDDE